MRERFGAELHKHLSALQPSLMQSVESWLEAEVPQIINRELDGLTSRITAGTLANLRTTLLPQLAALVDSSSLEDAGGGADFPGWQPE